jgi:hypothetical protein
VATDSGKQMAETLFGLENRGKISQNIDDYLTKLLEKLLKSYPKSSIGKFFCLQLL